MVVPFENKFGVEEIDNCVNVERRFIFNIGAPKPLSKVKVVFLLFNEAAAEEDFLWKLNCYFTIDNPVWKVGCGVCYFLR